MAGTRSTDEETHVTTSLGILGCGNIFGRYVSGLRRFPELRIVRVGDVDTGRAKDAAAEYDLPAWGDDGVLNADPFSREFTCAKFGDHRLFPAVQIV
jgi:hypothetical protein